MLDRVNGKPLLHRRRRSKRQVDPLVAMRAASFLLYLREFSKPLVTVTYLCHEVASKVGMSVGQLDQAALMLVESGKVEMFPTSSGVAVRVKTN